MRPDNAICSNCGRRWDEHDCHDSGCAGATWSVPECNCPERTCQPENNIGRFCWRSGCPIYASDFPTSITSFVEQK
jgi:hypothetical protein